MRFFGVGDDGATSDTLASVAQMGGRLNGWVEHGNVILPPKQAVARRFSEGLGGLTDPRPKPTLSGG
jgi:hypothetical protein